MADGHWSPPCAARHTQHGEAGSGRARTACLRLRLCPRGPAHPFAPAWQEQSVGPALTARLALLPPPSRPALLQPPDRDAQPARRPDQRHAGACAVVAPACCTHTFPGVAYMLSCLLVARARTNTVAAPAVLRIDGCRLERPGSPRARLPPTPSLLPFGATPAHRRSACRSKSCAACATSPTTSSCATRCCSQSTGWPPACATLAKRWRRLQRAGVRKRRLDAVAVTECRASQRWQCTPLAGRLRGKTASLPARRAAGGGRGAVQ